MENRIDILNELKELSPTLAAIEKVNVFTVPEGYFEYLGADILMLIEKVNGLSNTADVPAGYFDGLAAAVLTKIKAQQGEDAETETGTLSAQLSAIKQAGTFEVPAGYFDGLAAAVLTRIKAQEEEDAVTEISALSPRLSSVKQVPVFEVPQGYFDTLTTSILTKIKTAAVEDATTEIRALSPMLYSIQNEHVFEVPQGYFENLTGSVLDTVSPKAKVVSMKSRTVTFFKYAVAAAFTGVMALGVFKFTDTRPAGLDVPEYVRIANQVKDVDQELAKISNADIVKYLEADGLDVKAAIVANSTDQNELPTQEDYLLDDKALDKYLNSINMDDLKN